MRLLCVALVGALVSADVYLQTPSGSNNRLDEENRDRDNANRLFDSQNNNRGGYNVGQVYYYTGTAVHIDWANQHSCGTRNNNCEMIIQYMCDPRLRDGTVTGTIPDDPRQCYNLDCDTDVRYGRHESYEWYQDCKASSRNKGLFLANQNVKGLSARYTRQNPDGNRRGYECPEERDYYPYWRPTAWVDLAVFTNQPGRCAAYLAESENIKARHVCKVPAAWKKMKQKQSAEGFIPINQADCEAITYRNDAANMTEVGKWVEQKGAGYGAPAPECRENMWTRDNHNGHTIGGYYPGWNWTIPSAFVPNERCALRIRYNISTNDFEHFAANTRYQDQIPAQPGLGDVTRIDSPHVYAANNSMKPDDDNPARLDIWTQYRLSFDDNKDSFDYTKNNDQTKLKLSREYVLKTNPQVNMFGSLIQGKALKLQLAINTAQYGRTFEDRTHRFAVRAVPSSLAGRRIHNLNVRGKRGNIVQVYPATEYGFVPERLMARNGEYIHFQWTGSNTNPNNNAGQGRQGSDRHNVVILKDANYDEFVPDTTPLTKGQLGNNYPGRIDQSWAFLGFSKSDQQALAILDRVQFGGEMSELDDAGTYFDLGPRQITRDGIYHYLCTRNNNFSNRAQKGTIVVDASATASNALGSNGGVAGVGGASVTAAAGAFAALDVVTVNQRMESGSMSGYVTVSPLVMSLAPGQKVKVSVPYPKNPLGVPQMYYAPTEAQAFTEVSGAKYWMGVATVYTDKGGVYVVRNPVGAGPVVGLVIGCLAAIGLIGWVVYAKKHGRSLNPMAKS